MPRFGKDKDKDNRREELDRQAAEEVERLTRRGGPPSGMGGMGGMGGPPQFGAPSPLEMMAERVRDQPRPSERRAAPAPRRAAPAPTFTPLPTGGVGSSFGPAGLSPGPRAGASAPPPPAFGGGVYEEDGGSVTGPPVYNAGEPDEDEEMSITEMALMDHAARTGHNPEDLVIQYDASSAEQMRDAAMQAFYQRQQSPGPGGAGNNPFAPAGMRGGRPGAAPARPPEDPKAAGGALAQRLAERRRREEEEARTRRQPERGAASSPAAPAAEPPEGALGRVLARRRQSVGLDPEPAAPESVPEAEPSPAPGRRHARQRMEESPGLRGATLAAVPTVDDMADAVSAPAPAKRARKPAAKRSPAASKTAAAPAPAPPARSTSKATKAKVAKAGPAKAGPVKGKATPAKAATPAKGRAAAAKAATPAKKVKVKAVFCIECGEKNPAVAKFCFNCGTRLAAPEG